MNKEGIEIGPEWVEEDGLDGNGGEVGGARLRERIQGRMKNRMLLTTKRRLSARTSGDQQKEASREPTFQSEAPKPRQASGVSPDQAI